MAEVVPYNTVAKPIKWLLSGRQEGRKNAILIWKFRLSLHIVLYPRYHSRFMERIIIFYCGGEAHVSLMPDLVGHACTCSNMLEHVTISMICISLPEVRFHFHFPLLLRYHWPFFLCPASVRFCSCDLCGQRSFIAPSCARQRSRASTGYVGITINICQISCSSKRRTLQQHLYAHTFAFIWPDTVATLS